MFAVTPRALTTLGLLSRNFVHDISFRTGERSCSNCAKHRLHWQATEKVVLRVGWSVIPCMCPILLGWGMQCAGQISGRTAYSVTAVGTARSGGSSAACDPRPR